MLNLQIECQTLYDRWPMICCPNDQQKFYSREGLRNEVMNYSRNSYCIVWNCVRTATTHEKIGLTLLSYTGIAACRWYRVQLEWLDCTTAKSVMLMLMFNPPLALCRFQRYSSVHRHSSRLFLIPFQSGGLLKCLCPCWQIHAGVMQWSCAYFSVCMTLDPLIQLMSAWHCTY